MQAQAAAAAIFRKVSLERLSSPEQLDQILRVTTPRSWVALAAVGALLLVSVVWGVAGSIATKAAGEGVIVRSGSVVNVVTAGAGQIAALSVAVGDHVAAGKVVAKVAQPALLERIRLTEETLAEARAERDRALRIRTEMNSLQVEAVRRQKANALRDIEVLREQARLIAEQIPIDEELLAKGLITKQQTFNNKKNLVNTQGQIAQLEAQIKQFEAQEFQGQAQVTQARADMQQRISDLERNLAGLHKELEMASNVISPHSGQVIELKVVPGGSVAAGQPILSLQPDSEELDVLVYLPSEKAKAVTPGMEAQISPSTVKREEYGFMRGKVTFVAAFPATPASVNRNFENQSLVQKLLGSGPVTEVRVNLDRDADTVSGYKWSSRSGPPITITSGTICTAQIVTREQRPMSLVFPYIKEKLGVS